MAGTVCGKRIWMRRPVAGNASKHSRLQRGLASHGLKATTRLFEKPWPTTVLKATSDFRKLRKQRRTLIFRKALTF
jgi:hypothetical protein